MSHVFMTGSSTGLGLMAARLFVERGHRSAPHRRDRHGAAAAKRAREMAAPMAR